MAACWWCYSTAGLAALHTYISQQISTYIYICIHIHRYTLPSNTIIIILTPIQMSIYLHSPLRFLSLPPLPHHRHPSASSVPRLNLDTPAPTHISPAYPSLPTHNCIFRSCSTDLPQSFHLLHQASSSAPSSNPIPIPPSPRSVPTPVLLTHSYPRFPGASTSPPASKLGLSGPR